MSGLPGPSLDGALRARLYAKRSPAAARLANGAAPQPLDKAASRAGPAVGGHEEHKENAVGSSGGSVSGAHPSQPDRKLCVVRPPLGSPQRRLAAAAALLSGRPVHQLRSLPAAAAAVSSPEEKESLSSAPLVSSSSSAAVSSTRRSAPAGSLYPADSVVAYDESPFSFIDRCIGSPYTDEFVYLHPVSPYELRIVPHSAIDPRHYYTMSRSGVTHFHGDETSFTSLSQWEREYFLFARIRAIAFFGQYSAWKSFVVWRRAIRHRKMAACRAVLQQSLVTLNPHLRPALLAVKRLLHGASQWNVFVIGQQRAAHAASMGAAAVGGPKASTQLSLSAASSTAVWPLTLPSFHQLHARQQSANRSSVSGLSAECRSIVLAACQSDLQHFLRVNGFRGAEDGLSVSSTSGGGQSDDPADGVPRRVSHAEKAANRTKCRKLTKFVRLVDYLCTDALITLTHDRTRDALLAVSAAHPQLTPQQQPAPQTQAQTHAMHAAGSGSSALFSVELELSDADTSHSLLFHPSAAEFEQSVVRMVEEGAAGLMDDYPPLLFDAAFLPFTKNSLDDSKQQQQHQQQQAAAQSDEDEDSAASAGSGTSVVAASVHTPQFAAMLSDIRRALSSAFSLAAEHSASFHAFRDVFVRNSRLDIAAQYSAASIPVYGQLIAQFQHEIALIAAMPVNSQIGILCLDSARLKALFLPSPKQRLAELERLLPAVARDKVRSQLAVLKDAIAQLSSIPSTVTEFVGLQTFLATLHAGSDDEAAAFAYLTDLYALMSSAGLRVNESEKANFDKLSSTRQQFTTSLLLCEAAINANSDRFARELEGEQPILQQMVGRAQDVLKDARIASLDSIGNSGQVLALLRDQQAALSALEDRVVKYVHYQGVLQIEPSTPLLDGLKAVKADCEVKLSVWASLQTWAEVTDRWTHTAFDHIDVDEIAQQVSAYQKVHSKARRMLPADNAVVARLKDNIDEFADTLPLVTDLRSPHLQLHHWAAIEQLLSYPVHSQPANEFTLGTLVALNATQYRSEIAVIANSAAQEAKLRQQLQAIVDEWAALSFSVVSYKDSKDVFVLGSCEELLVTLDEALVAVNSILASRYVEPLRESVMEWNRRLLHVSECMEEWLAVQRQWLYLEVIFASGDIQRQLPDESSAFAKVDRAWKELMRRTNDQPVVMAACHQGGLKDQLHANNATLERIQKQLESYLETRRQAFPRFYFLSNDELLLILSQAKNPEAVQPHLSKCFDNIARLELSDHRDIRAMLSGEGERVLLSTNLKARGPAEAWLPALEADMVKSLRRYIKRGVADYDKMGRREWILDKYGQVVAVGSMIAWARQAQLAINGQADTAAIDSITTPEPSKAANNSQLALQTFLARQVAQLTELTELVRSPLSSMDRKKLIALIVTDVHNRDITSQLLEERVSSVHSFRWQQQLRFTWDAMADDCVVQQANASFAYGFEYQGLTSRLVITPLTDRCWTTITNALQLRYGAAPQGPAGTGKTESTKDLAKALGQLCLVVNCSEGMNYRTMAKLFSGLCQTGGWCCLDEFNRIDIEVLSVVAQQLLSVRQALLQQLTTFVFEGDCIPLRSTFGCMITMNPGYAGRTELPENLKVLFRPVSMMVPDYALIAEMMLFAEGFAQASTLSKKMTRLYKLASEQLSQQDHYDFGMRAVKSVLVMAGALKRQQPDESEQTVLIKAMKTANEAKFLSADLPLFAALIDDLFPSVVIEANTNEELQSAIQRAAVSSGLQPVPAFCNKVEQLYDTMTVRFGVMLVGDTGSGKSACHSTLSSAMNWLHDQPSSEQSFSKVLTSSLNPKSISMDELYGSVSALTQEWSDGLASSIMRAAMQDTDLTHQHWIHFDGPVDALWIENMNTVLDDNMTLCLVNGERMKLKPQMRMLFEVADLAVASPATVSRCGMVYLTAGDLGLRPFIQSWSAKQLSTALPSTLHRQMIEQLLLSQLPAAVSFLRAQCTECVLSSNIQLAMSCCALVQALCQQTKLGTAGSGVMRGEPQPSDGSESEPSASSLRLLECIVCFSVCWGVGGGLEGPDSALFDSFLSSAFSTVHPSAGSVRDYSLDVANGGEWRLWAARVPQFEYQVALPFYQMLVPTVTTVAYQSLLDCLLSVSRAAYLTGGSGVGKSAVIGDFFNGSRGSAAYSLTSLTFSAQTTSAAVQSSVEAKLVKYRKNLLGAAANVRCVVCVDDINLCGVEQFGAQPPVELLRQLCEYGGWYDRDRLFFKQITGCVLLCAAAPAKGGGRHELTSRLMKHFNLLCLPQPSEAILIHIFGSVLAGFLAPFRPAVQQLQRSLVAATVELYASLSAQLLPTPAKSHYTFNLRDVSAVFGGLLQIRPQCCQTAETAVRLWLHECQRCFADRLVDAADCSRFNAAALSLANTHFAAAATGLQLTEDSLLSPEQPIMFADWLTPQTDRDYTEYSYADSASQAASNGQSEAGEDEQEGAEQAHMTEATSTAESSAQPAMDGDAGTAAAVGDGGVAVLQSSAGSAPRSSGLSALLDDYLAEYNQSSQSNVQLVFFPSAISHISRISRILRQPRGHALLVGVGGSGKQSYTRLAANMAGMSVVSLSGGKTYGYSDFQADLRQLLLVAGVQGRDVVFLVNESAITHERFLEDINALLNGGEVNGLFFGDELTALIEELTPAVRDAGLPTSRESVYGAFVKRCTEHLHIVLCMSPVGDSFRLRCRQFPSLINCCTIDWYDAWPISALQSVAQRLLAPIELPSEAQRQALVAACVAIHCSVGTGCVAFKRAVKRPVYTTPKSYLDWIALFISLLHERRTALATARQHFLSGLTKLRETQQTVAELQETLTALQPVLVEKARESELLMEQIAVDTVKAASVRSVVEAEEAVVNIAAVEVRELTASAQADLDAALPALKGAMKSLEKLKKAEISEVKSMASPPAGVVKTMEMVCLLLNMQPDWETAKKVLANVSFLKDLQTYDKDNIAERTIKKLQKYTTDPELTEERMQQVSRAGAALLSWVLAMVDYSKVSKIVGPKREKLAELNANLAEKEGQLSEKQSQLKAVQDALQALQDKHNRATAERQELDDRSKLTAARLERAEKLIGGLGGEEVRWKQEAASLATQLHFVTGDAFLATAAIAYYGPFTGEFRARLVSEWRKVCEQLAIPLSADFSLQSTLATPHDIRSWLSNGLPNDSTSIDSGVVVKRCQRYPLCIDPQEQAKRWIKAEYRSKLMVCKASAKDALRVLELAIKTGSALLMEDVGEQVDSQLDPVLLKAVYTRGPQRLVRLGEQEVEWSERFRLFLTTKLNNPHYLPETQIKVTLLNFTVTRSGLEEQLLAEVVKRERPDVEEKSAKLVSMMAKDRRQLSEIEEKILMLLSTSEGNMLDNQSLIDTLEESKFTSHVIADRVKDNLTTQRAMSEIREQYRIVAARGACIFFLMQDLAAVDPMYQYSLSFFMRLFQSALLHSPQSPVLLDRLSLLLAHLTLLLFTSVSRGLFERHKLSFGFLLGAAIEREAGKLPAAAMRALTSDQQATIELAAAAASATGDGAAVSPLAPNPYASGGEVSELQWQWLRSLSHLLSPFNGLCESLSSSADRADWLSFLRSDTPWLCALPGLWDARLSLFDKLLLLRGLRSDHLPSGCSSFVSAVLGAEYAASVPASMDDVLAAADSRTPIMCILSAGADPTALLWRFARSRKAAFTMLSLGQGQGDNASRLVANAQSKGEWVCLANLHLGKSWLPQLEDIVERLGDEDTKVHPSFRLFLTSMPCDYFPVLVLQRCVKLTNEPPAGLRNNLLRSFTQVVSNADIDERGAEDQRAHDQQPAAPQAQAAAAAANQQALQQPQACGSAGGSGCDEDSEAAGGVEQSELVESSDAPASSTSSTLSVPSAESCLAYQKLLFGLVFFHAVIQERKWFGPIGFVTHASAEWNDSDLETSIATLRLVMQQHYSQQVDADADIADSAGADLPLDALRYVCGDIHYCGRVTDDSDRRLLACMLGQYFNPGIVRPDFKLSPSGLYIAPAPGPRAAYLAHIEALPSSAQPEVFRLHNNATLTLLKQRSQRLMDTLRAMQPSTAADSSAGSAHESAAGASSADSLLIAKAASIIAELPAPLSRQGAQPALFALTDKGVLPSLSVVLVQEMERFNRLLAAVRRSLADLQRAVRGEIAMSASLDDVQAALANNTVPLTWAKVAYPSTRPLSDWLADLNRRVAFFARWLRDGQPLDFWLPAFFFPQGFLTAALQQHARKTAKPIDSLHFAFHVCEPGQPLQQPEDGLLISGLYCEGGRWNAQEGALDEALDGQLFSAMPTVHFRPTDIRADAHDTDGKGQKDAADQSDRDSATAAPSSAAAGTSSEQHRTEAAQTYQCPVYKTSLRVGVLSTTGQSTNFVLSLQLPCKMSADHWTLRGTALLCQPD